MNIIELLQIGILTESIKYRNKIITMSDNFQGKTKPKINLKKYVKRILSFLKKHDKYCKNGPKTPIVYLVIGIEYIKRTKIELNELNIHRIILISILLACKFINDDHPDQSWFSEVGGISVNELNFLEYVFIRHLKWDFYINDHVFEKLIRKATDIFTVSSIIPRKNRLKCV